MAAAIASQLDSVAHTPAVAQSPVVAHEAASAPHRWVELAQSDALHEAHDAVDRLIAWAEAQRLRVIDAFHASGRSPLEVVHQHSTHSSVASMSRAERRAAVAARVPTFADALQRGDLSIGHLDRLGEALRRLLPHETDLLAADHLRLLHIACSCSAGRFARVLAREVARFERLRPVPESTEAGSPAADPAEARFAAQQAGIRLTSHSDRETGMTTWRWSLDPAPTGLAR